MHPREKLELGVYFALFHAQRQSRNSLRSDHADYSRNKCATYHQEYVLLIPCKNPGVRCSPMKCIEASLYMQVDSRNLTKVIKQCCHYLAALNQQVCTHVPSLFRREIFAGHTSLALLSLQKLAETFRKYRGKSCEVKCHKLRGILRILSNIAGLLW